MNPISSIGLARHRHEPGHQLGPRGLFARPQLGDEIGDRFVEGGREFTSGSSSSRTC